MQARSQNPPSCDHRSGIGGRDTARKKTKADASGYKSLAVKNWYTLCLILPGNQYVVDDPEKIASEIDDQKLRFKGKAYGPD